MAGLTANQTPNAGVAGQGRSLVIVPVLSLFMIAALWGATVAMTDEPRPIQLVYSVVFAVVVTLACRNDARNRHKPILPVFQFIMLFSWPIAVPIYLIWSRGWKGVLFAVAFTALFWIAHLGPAAMVYVIRTM